MRLPSVSVAHVVDGPDGTVERLHVVAADDWDVTTVRRDVETVLLHHFDLQLPAEAIRVEPLRRPQAAAPDAQDVTATEEDAVGSHRPVLDTVHLALRAAGTSVGVDLLHGDKRLRGTTGPVGAVSVLTAVVAATLDALRPRVEHTLEPVVAEVVQAGGDKIAVATIDASDGRSRQRLTGSALVRGNVEDAMARATLDATNRLLVSA